ncbi:T-cell immunoglobulin and mucin domain-containing protein 4-like isoform X3 [Mauremys mutica]|uniref:T-cell immunoglobulin and mucin domain-containing protein 4-like isoform X3 n=1 Tax=Mauremys mutica TaxID=74926 RepID=UPI001D16E743|nr:T-cell immunoglobulin and mucin domain-containing protein 4-like isoform X3 [Mauremys mutica]
MAHSLLLRWIVLQLYIAHGVSDTTVRAKVGQSVKLPCTYSVRQERDLNVMCWGRGICPSSKCSSEIVRTDGQKVISKQSGRYQLQGPITRGDVSLTISNVNHEDRGAYCCRIEIPGWFNDMKRNLYLQVYRESPTTVLISERTENVDSAFITEGGVLSTGTGPPVTVQTVPEVSEVNAISDATFPLTPAGGSVKEGLDEETSTDSKLWSEESVDNPTQHLQNEIPTVTISVVVTVILLFTFLLVVFLTYKRSGKYRLLMRKSSDLSGEQIPNGVEEENTLFTLQQIPDSHSVSQGTCHDPVESSI